MSCPVCCCQVNTVHKGLTPLIVACHEGQKDMCSCLLAQGADINGRGDKGNTPLGAALEGSASPSCFFTAIMPCWSFTECSQFSTGLEHNIPVANTYKGSKERLFIWTQTHNLLIFRVIPFVKLQSHSSSRLLLSLFFW